MEVGLRFGRKVLSDAISSESVFRLQNTLFIPLWEMKYSVILHIKAIIVANKREKRKKKKIYIKTNKKQTNIAMCKVIQY